MKLAVLAFCVACSVAEASSTLGTATSAGATFKPPVAALDFHPVPSPATTESASGAPSPTQTYAREAAATPSGLPEGSSLNTSVQAVPLPPLLTPQRYQNASTSRESRDNSTYMLNTWTGRIQLQIGNLFEGLVQASIPEARIKAAMSAQNACAGSRSAGSCPPADAGSDSLRNSTAKAKDQVKINAGTSVTKPSSCTCTCDHASSGPGAKDGEGSGSGGDDDEDEGSGSGNGSGSNGTQPSTSPLPQTATASAPSASPKPTATQPQQRSCFPALDFKMPDNTPDADALDGWWCDMQDEYAFMGFSYDLSTCPSLKKLRSDFKRMRTEFNARYVRFYSACDRAGLNDDLVTAAWENSLGLHMLIWFGFEGGNKWRTRKRDIIRTIKYNPRAPFVVRAVVVGSEPLFDWVLSPDELAQQIVDVKNKLSDYTRKGLDGMQVTLSEMPYGFMAQGNAPSVFRAMDVIQGNILPFFDQRATTGGQAWPLVTDAYAYFQRQAKGKKVLYTQIGWPSDQSVWKANSDKAVASIKSQRAFFNLLDRNCEWFKTGTKGGVGWFAHIWNDEGLPGWGILDYSGKLKFNFSPRTSC